MPKPTWTLRDPGEDAPPVAYSMEEKGILLAELCRFADAVRATRPPVDPGPLLMPPFPRRRRA